MRQLLLVIMDGIGVNASSFGNAVHYAQKPHLARLQKMGLYRTLFAHGPYVGLPSEDDIGNSEVGHNALGAGQIYDQGAKLVNRAIASGQIFKDRCWRDLISWLKDHDRSNATLHFIGLLSDGGVHSHEQHLYALMRQAAREGVQRIRIHVLFDGRDVGEKSAEVYVQRLNKVIDELRGQGVDVEVASGGGRMHVTMDRYEADWSIVERGWKAHVQGQAEYYFDGLDHALAYFRENTNFTDQYLPSFVIVKDQKPVGKIKDGDAVVFFNFRGDRAIEISRAFTEDDASFPYFDRGKRPQVFFAGMMQYDGDLKIPERFLVSPPTIEHTLGEYMAQLGVRQYACSETQKFGHVTYFWNGNRSGKFNEKLEEYVEIESDRVPFNQKPEMKAKEITDDVLKHLDHKSFDFGRINFANGDMVGHTGDFHAAVQAIEVIDQQIGRLVDACQKANCLLVVTSDHGNADEMFDASESDWPDWQQHIADIPPKTSHTKNPVPLMIWDPRCDITHQWQLKSGLDQAGLAHVAATILDLMGLPADDRYLPTLVEKRRNI